MGNEASQEAQEHAPIENNVEAHWIRAPLSGDAINPREGHNTVTYNNKLYIFGGGGGEEQFNEMIVVDLQTNVVSKLTPTGTIPSGRTGATSQIVDGKIWIIGGLSTASRGWVNDVYSYDIENNKWTFEVPSGDRPSPRDKLSSCLVGKKIYVFGGFGPRPRSAAADDDDDEEEEDEDEEDEGEEGEEGEGEEEKEGKVKVQDFDWFDDVFILDTESSTVTWSKATVQGLIRPSGRCASGLVSLDASHLFVFGGRDASARRNDSFVLNLETMTWSMMNPLGRAPDARSFHTCTRVNGGVLVFGGMGANNSHFQDLHVLSHVGPEQKLSWIQPSLSGTEHPTARGFHTATPVGTSVYIFGGSSGFDSELMCVTRFSNDLFKLDLADKQPSPTPQQQE